MGRIKTAITGIGAGVLLIAVILALVAVSAAIGGLIGASIAASYNVLLGQSFAVWDAALIGSIVGVAGGASASTSS